LVGIPKRELAVFYALHPKESGRDKIRGKVSFGEKIPALKEVIKKKDGGKKKGQTRQKVG